MRFVPFCFLHLCLGCLRCLTSSLLPKTAVIRYFYLQALFTTIKKPDYTLLGEDAYAKFKMEPLLNRLDIRGYGTCAIIPFLCYVWCFHLVDQIAEAILTRPPRPCSNECLNDPLLSRLGDNLLQLRSIDIRGCSNVSRNGAQTLGSRLADRWQLEAKSDAVQYNYWNTKDEWQMGKWDNLKG